MRQITITFFFLCLISAAFAQKPNEVVSAENAFSVVPLDCNSAPLLSCGTTRSGSPSCLSGTFYLDLYTFAATAGQTLTITATTTTSYQMLVTIQDLNGIVKSNFGPSPVSLTYTFPGSGNYYIGFGFVANYAVGPYSLALACPNATSQCQYTGSVTVGSNINGSLTTADTTCATSNSSYYKVYKLTVGQGDAFIVSLSGQFAPYVEIDPKSGGGFGAWSEAGAATLSYLSPSAQTIDIWVGSNTAARTTGSFTLQVTRDPNGPCKHRAAGH